MNQHEPAKNLGESTTSNNVELNPEILANNGGVQQREWLPEDDDDWYEPDYRRPERRAS